MEKQLIFVISPPRSGSTLLQRMLGSHTDIFTHPEPHIISPLAHLGYYHNVDKAPYDHINAAQAIREFVEDLPDGEQDYLKACRAYTDVLYGRMLEKSGKKMFLDKTPANALVLSFLTGLYPTSYYLVLTRHPLAILSSYANSFFEGDYQSAVAYNNILGRYIPAMARFMRQSKIKILPVCYEQLVNNPERSMSEIFSYLGLPDQPDVINYGHHQHADKSYGDPKIKHHMRPITSSVDKWASELASDAQKLRIAKQLITGIENDDLDAWGYEKSSIFDPVAGAEKVIPSKDARWYFNVYRLKRKIFLRLRKNIHHNRTGRVLKRIQYYCDVLLRE